MKILQINSVYKVGSTGKIVDSIGQALREQGHEVFTCYGLGEEYYDDYSQKVCSNLEHKVNALLSRLTGIPFGGLFLSNKLIYKKIQSFQPDVVHVHCVNASTMNVYKLFKYLAKSKIKTVITLHAEIFHTGGCGHAFECEKFKTQCHNCDSYKRNVGSWLLDRSRKSWSLMNEAFSAFDKDNIIITAVSPWLVERAKQSAILKDFRVEFVPNGVNTSVFHYYAGSSLVNRNGYNKIALFVTPIFSLDENDIKGGRFLPSLAKRLGDCLFAVVSTRTTIDQGQLPANVLMWGKAKSQEELAKLYSQADITILLSKRETFSMVTAESLCCGTPVVGFKAGGPESIAMSGISSFVEYGDVRQLTSLINTVNSHDKQSISDRAIKEYSPKTAGLLYSKVYNKIS